MTTEIKIHKATPEEVNRLVPLLPLGAHMPVHAEFFAAREAVSDRLVGGAYILFVPTAAGDLQARFQCGLENGIMEDSVIVYLINAMKVVARKTGAERLVCQGPVWEGGDLERNLRACHFSREGDDVPHYSLDMSEPNWDRFGRTYRRLTDRGRIPEDASVVSLNRVALAPVAELLRNSLGGADEQLTREILNPETPSVVMMRGSTVRGVHVVSANGSKAHTSSLVVEAGDRSGWIYTVLVRDVYERLTDLGVKEWTFKTNPGIHRSMLNFAKTLNARMTGSERLYVFPMEEGDAPEAR